MENIEVEIRKQFYNLFKKNYSELEITIRYGISDIAQRISICRCGEENAENIPKIQSRISANFNITPSGSSRKNFHSISRKYTPKNQLFLEPRYFSLESAIELALATGMSEEDFFNFSKIILGFQWIYLRNIEYLIGLYSIRFGLQPIDYYELKQYAKELKIKNQSPLQTRITLNFKSEFDEFQKEVTDKYCMGNIPSEWLMKFVEELLMKLIKDNIGLIQKQDSRTLNDFLNECCVRFFKKESLSELQENTRNFKKEYKKNSFSDDITENFKDVCNKLFDCIEKDLIEKRKPIKDELKNFLDENITNIQGRITRTLETVRNIIDYPHNNSWLAKKKLKRTSSEYKYDTLYTYMIAISLPWEYKNNGNDTADIGYSFKKENVRKMVNLDMSESIIQAQINKYFSLKEKLFPESLEKGVSTERKRNVDLGRTDFTENFSFEKINMRRLRNDFVRIMIMDFTSTDSLESINNRLEEHSFLTLRDDDPFDYLVISTIKIYEMQNKPDKYQNKEPYEILSELFALVKEYDSSEI